MTTITGLPGSRFSLDLPAGLSFMRMVSASAHAVGVADINSAYRSLEDQERLFLSRYTPQATGVGKYADVRWYQGVRYVRTSPLGMVAVPGRSQHTKGLALDIDTDSPTQAWMLAYAAPYGWHRIIASEPWHWEYAAHLDTVAAQASTTPPTARKDTTMIWMLSTPLGTWAMLSLETKVVATGVGPETLARNVASGIPVMYLTTDAEADAMLRAVGLRK